MAQWIRLMSRWICLIAQWIRQIAQWICLIALSGRLHFTSLFSSGPWFESQVHHLCF